MLATIGTLTLFGFAGCAALLGFGISSVSKSVQSTITPRKSVNNSDKTIVFDTPNKNTPYIAGIKFEEEIRSEFADSIIAKLRYAQKDTNAVGVLIEVSSPGGVVVPSQEIYDVVHEVAETKPVVALVRSMAASGAYYSIAPATEIIAGRGSLIGSIGVIMQGFEVEELLKTLKIESTTLTTGKLKDAGSPFRQMTSADRDYLKGILDQIFSTFVNDVKAARPAISQKDLNFMSDGRVVLAPQAKKLNLIDMIGDKELAQTEIKRLSKQKADLKVFYYEDIKPFSEFFTEKFISGSTKIIKNSLNQTALPTF